jgi:hypothetical protein
VRPPADAPPVQSGDQVAALVAPVRRPDAVDDTDEARPAERAPEVSRPRAAAVTLTKSTRRLRPGDLICGACGEGNLPTRKFCGRCGESLATAEVARMPWWRRLFRRRGAKVVAANRRPGQRPGGRSSGLGQVLRRIYRTGRLVIAVIVLAAGVLYGAYPPFRTEVNNQVAAVKDKVTSKVNQVYVPVHAVKIDTNAQDPGHPAAAAFDEALNTYWLAPAAPGQNPTVTLTFGHPVTLERMIVHSGASDGYTAHGRPSLLLLVFSNQESDTINLQDTAKQQTVTITHALQVSSMQIQVAESYAGGTPPDMAIAEIELFALP